MYTTEPRPVTANVLEGCLPTKPLERGPIGQHVYCMHFLQATTSDVLLCPLTVIGALQDRRYTPEQVATFVSHAACASL